MKYLPFEVIFQILIRLPVDSLLRFTLVCKLWYRMINLDRTFIKAHLDHARSKNDDLSFRRHLVVSKRDMFSYGYENPLKKRSEFFSLPFKNAHEFPKAFQHVSVLASCNGLVLLRHHQYDYYLWNPSMKLYNQFSGLYFYEEDCVAFGLGYDEASEAYKVVGIFQIFDDEEKHNTRVYNCRTDRWKLLDDPFPYNIYDPNSQCAVVNGAPHWLLLRNQEGTQGRDENKGDLVIVYFDLGDEKFKEVGGPDWLAQAPKFTELCAFDEKLCLVKYVPSSEDDERLGVEIWAMKTYGAAQSWACLFTPFTCTDQCGMGHVGATPLFSTKDGKILLERKRSTLVFYDPKNPDIDAAEHLELAHVPYKFYKRLETTSYVESLVSPYAWGRAVG